MHATRTRAQNTMFMKKCNIALIVLFIGCCTFNIVFSIIAIKCGWSCSVCTDLGYLRVTTDDSSTVRGYLRAVCELVAISRNKSAMVPFNIPSKFCKITYHIEINESDIKIWVWAYGDTTWIVAEIESLTCTYGRVGLSMYSYYEQIVEPFQ